MRKRPVSESEVLRACKEYLSLRGAAFVRVNGGRFKIPGTNRWFRSTDKNGVADILVCCRGKFYAVECKSAKGRLSEEQKEFRAYVERAGGTYVLARGIEDLENADL
jgi:Holliday junction resolvase